MADKENNTRQAAHEEYIARGPEVLVDGDEQVQGQSCRRHEESRAGNDPAAQGSGHGPYSGGGGKNAHHGAGNGGDRGEEPLGIEAGDRGMFVGVSREQGAVNKPGEIAAGGQGTVAEAMGRDPQNKSAINKKQRRGYADPRPLSGIQIYQRSKKIAETDPLEHAGNAKRPEIEKWEEVKKQSQGDQCDVLLF